MGHDDTNRTDRRTFLQAGALATAAAASATFATRSASAGTVQGRRLLHSSRESWGRPASR